MPIDKETIKYVAQLARIELNPKELEKLSEELKGVLGFIDSLNKLDTSSAQPTSHILVVNNVLRQDSPEKPLSAQKALENAPQQERGFFSVPKVIE